MNRLGLLIRSILYIKICYEVGINPKDLTVLTPHYYTSASKPAKKMDLVTAIRIFVYSLFTMTVLLSPLAMCHEAEDNGEYNYDPFSKNGPFHWGEIRSEWYLCKNGSMQSPINLQESIANKVNNSGLQRSYRPSNATLRNSGHDIMIDWSGDAGHILINGTRYMLEQCHWHSPSEHTINGRRYDLEIHFVHISSEGLIAVIGVLYKIGKEDPFLLSIKDDLKYIGENKDEERSIGIVDPEEITRISSNSTYFRYNGSLTTPPCDENVLWTVYTEVKTVTWKQIKLLRVAVRDKTYTNARPLQPRNGRPVTLYKPTDHEEN
ncbi:hypothetical protein VNO77_27470 [Canavalia gladiata]|uniref:Carbonic anhydrase n=1 Tax=Canavalia gladiata TaxID=3824 RepID=A0AAN9KVV2_CANGL